MKHTNKIAIDILTDEYGDYTEYPWEYDREYNNLVEAQKRLINNQEKSAKYYNSVIGRLFCNVGFHSYRFSHSTGINEYYECNKCKKRKVRFRIINGYQPINREWLDGQ